MHSEQKKLLFWLILIKLVFSDWISPAETIIRTVSIPLPRTPAVRLSCSLALLASLGARRWSRAGARGWVTKDLLHWGVEAEGLSTLNIEPPVAHKGLHVEQGAVGAEEGGREHSEGRQGVLGKQIYFARKKFSKQYLYYYVGMHICLKIIVKAQAKHISLIKGEVNWF